MTPLFEEIWTCTSCHWEGLDSEIVKKEIHIETILEPAEWEWYCPDCNRSNTLEEKDERTLCKTCEENEVQDENEMCTECMTCYGEELNDIAKGH